MCFGLGREWENWHFFTNTASPWLGSSATRWIGKALVEPFVIASRMGREKVVKELIDHENVDVNFQDENDRTALFMASLSNKQTGDGPGVAPAPGG